MNDPPDDCWRLELEPITDADWKDIPAEVRLRRGLKYLLRTCGLRCTRLLSAEDMTTNTKENDLLDPSILMTPWSAWRLREPGGEFELIGTAPTHHEAAARYLFQASEGCSVLLHPGTERPERRHPDAPSWCGWFRSPSGDWFPGGVADSPEQCRRLLAIHPWAPLKLETVVLPWGEEPAPNGGVA